MTPALQYYFDNKEGVYLACAERIVSRVWEHMSEVVERAERVLADNPDESALIEMFCEIQGQVAEMIDRSQHTDHWRPARRNPTGARPGATRGPEQH